MHLEESKLHPQTPWFFQEPKTLVKHYHDSYKLSNDRWMAPVFCFRMYQDRLLG